MEEFRFDMERERRTGVPEVVFASGKSATQIADIAATGIAADGAGQVVTLALAGAENPWLCHVDAEGTVVDVIYQGEG